MLYLYNLKIRVFGAVYEPAEDTFLLISALEKLNLKNNAALEVGTGSGIIALILARRAKTVLAADINPEAVECAKENAKRNKITNIEFRESDLFENIRGRFDLIVFNPPYLPEERVCDNNAQSGLNNTQISDDEERNHDKSLQPRLSDDDESLTSDIALDGGKNGRRVIDRFVRAAPKFLKGRGSIFLLESSLSQYGKTLAYFKKRRMRAEVFAKEKLEWEKLVAVRARW